MVPEPLVFTSELSAIRLSRRAETTTWQMYKALSPGQFLKLKQRFGQKPLSLILTLSLTHPESLRQQG